MELHMPTQGDFCLDRHAILAETYRANHQLLLEHHLTTEFPFFGFHGDHYTAYHDILQNQRGKGYICTFADKERSLERYFLLQALVLYSASFSRCQARPHQQRGGLVVFNLECNGRNLSYPHMERGLYILHSSPQFDSEEEARVISDIQEMEWARSEIGFSGRFAERIIGGVSLENTLGELSFDEVNAWHGWKRNVGMRFLAQKTLARIYDLLPST
jgi:hypothetical protein